MMKRKADNPTSSLNKKSKTFRDENAPKPPINAYMYFVRQEAKNIGNMKGLASAWAVMNEEQRRPFVEQATIGRQEYEKAMEVYKKTTMYQQFLNRKSMQKHSRNDEDIAHDLNGVTIFSKQFLDYNKSREATLRKLRKEIYDIEEETEDLEKKISAATAEIQSTQEALYADESHNEHVKSVLEKWRKQTLKALQDAHLLTHFHLNANSTVEDLLQRLEEVPKKHDSHSNSLRTCLSAAIYN